MVNYTIIQIYKFRYETGEGRVLKTRIFVLRNVWTAPRAFFIKDERKNLAFPYKIRFT